MKRCWTANWPDGTSGAMILLFTFLLLAVVLAFVGYPLLAASQTVPHDDPDAAAPAAETEQRERLLSERQSVLATLRDLQFDHEIGNLSDRDYDALQGPHRRKAVTILRALDHADDSTPATPGRAQAGTLAQLALDDRLEAEIARVRARLARPGGGTTANEPSSAPTGTRCPDCGAPHAVGARYCTRCGRSFDVTLTCRDCAAPRGRDDEFCASCGHRFGASDDE